MESNEEWRRVAGSDSRTCTNTYLDLIGFEQYAIIIV
jgi:hypothetical protein